MADVRISNGAVTSSAVRLRGAEINFSWDNLISTEPIPGYFPTTSAQNTVQFNGWENPRTSVRGILDESSSKLSDGITFSLLKSFAKSTGSTYIFDDVIYPTGQLVVIDSFKVLRRATDKASEKYDYTMEFIETL